MEGQDGTARYKKPIKEMTCLPSEIGEQGVQYHEILVQLFLCEMFSPFQVFHQ